MINTDFMRSGEKAFYLIYKDCPLAADIVREFYIKIATSKSITVPNNVNDLNLCSLMYELSLMVSALHKK